MCRDFLPSTTSWSTIGVARRVVDDESLRVIDLATVIMEEVVVLVVVVASPDGREGVKENKERERDWSPGAELEVEVEEPASEEEGTEGRN